MSVRVADRRRDNRAAATHFAVLSDRRNRTVLARGRTANISENGILLVLRRNSKIPESGEVCARITIPGNPAVGTSREVIYRCRIVRRQELGNMLGLGLEFLTKLT